MDLITQSFPPLHSFWFVGSYPALPDRPVSKPGAHDIGMDGELPFWVLDGLDLRQGPSSPQRRLPLVQPSPEQFFRRERLRIRTPLRALPNRLNRPQMFARRDSTRSVVELHAVARAHAAIRNRYDSCRLAVRPPQKIAFTNISPLAHAHRRRHGSVYRKRLTNAVA